MCNNIFVKTNLNLLIDFYELTMANGYLETKNSNNQIAVFDMFYRQVPDGGGFVIFAGLSQIVSFVQNLSFTDEQLSFLKKLNLFSESFLNYLKNFKFCCTIWSVKEGTPIFPNEPFLIVKGPLAQVQMFETFFLNVVNHQCLIATKANRIVRAAKGKPILEFGARRAHGFSSAVFGSRAAYIGGCTATSCVEAGFKFKIPLAGTMSHSWVQSFDSELEAFETFIKLYPENCVLLVDTYNVLKSGVPNAIKIFKTNKFSSKAKKAIRIDSGDIYYLSKQARAMLDSSGCFDVSIVVSNSLDEFLIEALNLQGACVDEFAVGENLITSKSSPVFGGVYKLSAIGNETNLTPKIKISESIEKINLPGLKKVYRFFDCDTKKCVADLITLSDEIVKVEDGFEIFDPQAIWKRKILKNVVATELLVTVFDSGRLVYFEPELKQIRQDCLNYVENGLWEEIKRFENPHKYYVDWSEKLLNLRNDLIKKCR